ncbi:hypothetical protein TIFTF001_038685 [Ficus carica]|uniref:Uncharacterized protein n=1 Tax=Ficus carica TaxID=3494 RepID=A0AA88EAY9_FICCA|nr:hypothetical protein TIFTF001_038685 [Ficus carica]
MIDVTCTYGSPKCKGRGKAKLLDVVRKVATEGKLNVEFDHTGRTWKAIRDNGPWYDSAIGDWFNFDLDANGGLIRSIIDRDSAKCHKDWKNDLHNYFKELGGDDNEEYVRAQPPSPRGPQKQTTLGPLLRQVYVQQVLRKHRRQIQITAIIISRRACMAEPYTYTSAIRSSKGCHSLAGPRYASRAYDENRPHTSVEDRPKCYFILEIPVEVLDVNATSAGVFATSYFPSFFISSSFENLISFSCNLFFPSIAKSSSFVAEGEDEIGEADVKFIGFGYLEKNQTSKLKVKEVKSWRERFGILNGIEIQDLNSIKRVTSPREGWLALYELSLLWGMRFLCQRARVEIEPSVEDLCCLYSLKQISLSKGWFILAQRKRNKISFEKVTPQVCNRLTKLQATSYVAVTPRVAVRTRSASAVAIMFASKLKKEFLSHAEVIEKMGDAKSLVVKGKGKAGDLGNPFVIGLRLFIRADLDCLYSEPLRELVDSFYSGSVKHGFVVSYRCAQIEELVVEKDRVIVELRMKLSTEEKVVRTSKRSLWIVKRPRRPRASILSSLRKR